MLSVIITESRHNPAARPSGELVAMKIRLGCPIRARLLDTIATIACGIPLAKSSRCITSAGRCLAVRSRNWDMKDQDDVTAAGFHRESLLPAGPNPRQRSFKRALSSAAWPALVPRAGRFTA